MNGAVAVGLLIAGALAADGGQQCVDESPQMAAMERAPLRLSHPDHGELELEVHVADEVRERIAGFQHICADAVARSAILFVFPAPVTARFHMRNVHAPLDIAFIGGDGRVREVMRMEAEAGVSAAQARLYGPDRPFAYALEAPAGWLTARGVDGDGWRMLR